MATPVKHTPTPIQTYQPPSTPSTRPAAVSTISEEQRKYAHSILRVLKRQPEAKPFLLPVDIAGLGLVDYLDKVPIPMDISTVEKKLTGRVYASVQEFTADVTLIWNNCYAYNGPESPYSLRAKVLEGLFSRHITRMPGVGVSISCVD
jgi:bromodomain-containing factor 1